MAQILNTIFETHDRFPKKVFGKDGILLDFNRQNLNLVKDQNGNNIRLNKTDSWICVLTDPEKIEEAKNHRAFKSSYWIINKIPTKGADAGSIVRSGIAASQGGMEISIKEMKQKAIQFGELKGKVMKSDGTYFASATPNQIDEFKKLEKELNEGDI